jgi:hypothetical protein
LVVKEFVRSQMQLLHKKAYLKWTPLEEETLCEWCALSSSHANVGQLWKESFKQDDLAIEFIAAELMR